MMKSSLRRLRSLSLHKHGHRQRKGEGLIAHQDELFQAAEDIHNIRNCYDSLLSAAAAAANSAYAKIFQRVVSLPEFSEALGEYGTCLLKKTSLNDDEASGKTLLMIGKAQLELQKIANVYRAHVVQTISTPSESLLKELQTVEEMKRQCDDKRDIYKSMLDSQREIGRSKNVKGENISQQQLQAAQDDYEEEAILFLFRLKSLKRGQSRSLFTQASRHYASQLNFFRKGVKSLEALESRVKAVAEEHHIDYQFSGLDDDQLEEYADDEYSHNDDDGELSFDFEHHNQYHDVSSFSRNSTEENLERAQANYVGCHNSRVASMSAPLSSTKKWKPSEMITQMHPSLKTFNTYALPTPLDVKSSTSIGSGNSIYGASSESNKGGWTTQPWHSSPLQPNMIGKDSQDIELPSPTSFSTEPSLIKESNIINNPATMPSHVSEGMLSKSNPVNEFDSKLSERQAFSVPLTCKPLSSKHALFATKMSTMEALPEASAKPKHIPTPKLSIPQKVSPNASSPVTSPRINELHELPRPPTGYAKHRPPILIGHSAPLISRVQEISATSKPTPFLSHTAAPLPKPPGVMARSFSIPSSVQRSNLKAVNSLDLPQSQKTITDSSSTRTPLVNNEVG